MTKQTEIKGNAITEREDELWQAVYAVAYRDAVRRGLGFRAARRPARMNANAEIVRLRLHPDTEIESMDHADAVVEAMEAEWQTATAERFSTEVVHLNEVLREEHRMHKIFGEV